ncbi:hypothetical protein [Chryseobacterium sp. 8AT]|nr:hypothetical protein [Chryseobacterium sp. 8AT]
MEVKTINIAIPPKINVTIETVLIEMSLFVVYSFPQEYRKNAVIKR